MISNSLTASMSPKTVIFVAACLLSCVLTSGELKEKRVGALNIGFLRGRQAAPAATKEVSYLNLCLNKMVVRNNC